MVYSGYYRIHRAVQEDGKCIEWASRKDVPYIGGNKDIDVVVIIARHKYSNKWVVIHQYRPVIGKMIYEFPAGKIDKGETPIKAAKRELREETGLCMGHVNTIVPKPTFVSVGITDESASIVICDCYGELSTKNLQKGEQISPQLMSNTELKTLLHTNHIISTKLATFIVGMLTEEP